MMMLKKRDRDFCRTGVSFTVAALGTALLIACHPAASASAGAHGSGATSATSVRAVTTGNPLYDEFFDEVTSLQSDIANTASEQAISLKPLQSELGAEGGHADMIAEKAGARAQELSTSVRLDVRGISAEGVAIPGEGVVVKVAAGGADPSPKGRAFTAALEKTAKAEGEQVTTFFALALRARKLKTKVEPLRGEIPKELDGRSPDDQKRVDDALVSARSHLDEASQTATQKGTSVGLALRKLAAALDAGTGAAHPKHARHDPSKSRAVSSASPVAASAPAARGAAAVAPKKVEKAGSSTHPPDNGDFNP